MSRRILILSASVGSGHVRAAQALEEALRRLDPGVSVKNVDVLGLTGPAFRRLYGKTYYDLVRRAPHLLGYLYDLLDRPPSPQKKADRLRVLVEKMNFRRFLDLLHEEPWDLLVNTHFLPAEIIASVRRKNEIGTPQFIVTTDFDPHRLWVQEPAEAYFTATEEGRRSLASWGIPLERIRATGIPIHPGFGEPLDRRKCLEEFGLPGDRPVILQMAGGLGAGPVEKLLGSIFEIGIPLDIVAVAGRNEELRLRLERVQPPPRHRFKALGFIDRIAQLIAASDLVISKPGGLTTSEILALGGILVVVSPIPGQESRNSDFVLESGAGIKINSLSTLAYKIENLLGDRERLSRLQENSRRQGRPGAAFDIARAALEWTSGGQEKK